MPPTSLRVYLTLGLALGSVLAALLGWPGPALAVSEPERLWTVGDRAFQDGLFAQSRRMLERLLERYPSDSRAPDATPMTYQRRRVNVRSATGPHRNRHTFAEKPMATMAADVATENPARVRTKGNVTAT